MPVVNVLDGSAARAIHVRQILGWLRGIPTNSEPTSFTGITNTERYALTVLNNDTEFAKALSVMNAAATIRLLEVSGDQTILRPGVSGGIIFRVRNTADDGDLFSVNSSGAVSIGSVGGAVSETGTQTLTNKTIDGGILTSSIVSDFLDITQTVGAPANPASNVQRIYMLQGDAFLRYRNNAGAVEILVTEDEAQSLTNKTVTSASLGTPTISDTALFTGQGSAPSAPSAGTTKLFSLSSDDLLRYRTSAATRVLATLDGTETLTNKTINSAALGSPTINEFLKMNDRTGAAPTIGATEAAIYKTAAANTLLYKSGSDTERIIVDTAQTQTLTDKTMTAPVLNNSVLGDYTTINARSSAIPTPGSGVAYIWMEAAGAVLKYKASSDTERTIVDTDSTQSLSNKSFDAGLALTTPALTGALLENYADMKQVSSPGAPASTYSRVFAKSDNNLYYHPNGGSETLLLTNSNATSVAASGFARGLCLGVL